MRWPLIFLDLHHLKHPIMSPFTTTHHHAFSLLSISLFPHMATSSPQPQSLIISQQPPSTTANRRLPPPCWSHDETVALIDAYREKWYSLRRGNLRATHWQEVADDVAARCPLSTGNPQKTSVQCRHKMEKVRKRYRAETSRAATTPKGHQYCSSWVHFKRMDAMEKGSSLTDQDPIYSSQIERDDGEDDEDLYPRGIKQGIPIPNHQRFYGSMNNGNFGSSNSNKPSGGNGFRIKIPGGSATAVPPQPMYNRTFDEYSSPNYPNYGLGKDGYLKRFGGSSSGGGERKRRERNPVEEMVSAIKMLGDGFVRIERMKMDMARELESKRMEMEMQRTEMILESQQRIVGTFSKALLEKKNKKLKRIPTPES